MSAVSLRSTTEEYYFDGPSGQETTFKADSQTTHRLLCMWYVTPGVHVSEQKKDYLPPFETGGTEGRLTHVLSSSYKASNILVNWARVVFTW